jgi:cyanate permease
MADFKPATIITMVIGIVFIAYLLPNALGTFMTELSNATGLTTIQVQLLSMVPLAIIAGIVMKYVE